MKKKWNLARVKELPEMLEERTAYVLEPNFVEQEYWERVDRELGLYSKEELAIFLDSTMVFFGCGGMGSEMVLRAVRKGIGTCVVFDPEAYDSSNRNRQSGATRLTLGHNKAVATVKMAREIADDTTVVLVPGKLDDEVAELLAEYFARADAAFDEIELLAIEGRLTVHDIGRRLGWDIFNCNTLGYGTNLFLFTNEGMSLFECMGLDEDEAQRLVKRLQNDEVEPEEHARLQALLEAVLIPDFPEYSADPSVFSTRANWHERLRTEGRAIVTATNPPGACAFVLDQAMAHVIRKRSPIRRIGAVPPKMPGYMNIDFLTVTTRTVTEAWFPLKGTAS